MDQIIHFFSSLNADLGLLKYLFVFLITIIEGPMMMVLAGFLARLGYFDIFLVAPFLLAGDLVGDWFWYSLGRFQARKVVLRFGHYVGLDATVIARVEGLFAKYQNRILFISKMTMGFGFALATLITAGMLRIKFRDYMLFNFFGGIVWVTGLLSLGYFIGHAYLAIDFAFRIVFIIATIIVLGALFWGFSRYMRKKYYSPDKI